MTRSGCIYLGFVLSVGAFPVGLLRLLEGHPWPWVGIFLALAVGTIGLAVWSLLKRPRLPDVPPLPLGIPTARHEAGAGPHPVRRAALFAPLAFLWPRSAAATGAVLPMDPLDLADLRAADLAEHTLAAIGNLALQDRHMSEPWADVPMFEARLRYAIRRGAEPEASLAHAANAEQWKRILGRLHPGADVLGRVKRRWAERIERHRTRPNELRESREFWAKLRGDWKMTEVRRAKTEQVVAVLRGAA